MEKKKNNIAAENRRRASASDAETGRRRDVAT